MSLADIETDVKTLTDALVHEAADEYSVIAARAAMSLLARFFGDIHRIAAFAEITGLDALGRLRDETPQPPQT